MTDERPRAPIGSFFIRAARGLRAGVHPSSLILLCSGILFGILAYPLAVGRVYTFSDYGAYHLPLRAFYRECLQQGLNFTWMPSILCGYYAHAEGQAGMYHPVHYLLYRWLALEPAFAIECVIAYPVMFLGMAAFLRRWRQPLPSCLFGAFLFTFSGFNLLHSMQINVIQVVAHLPWLLAGIDIAMRGTTPRARRLAATGVALTAASQWLLGFPQAVYFSALAEGPYALLLAGWLIRRKHTLREVASRLAWLLAAQTVGMLLGAIQWIPTLDMLGDSARSNPPAAFSFSLSLEPRNLLQLIGPYFFRGQVYAGRLANPMAVEFGLYNGAVATVLAVWALCKLSTASLAARPVARRTKTGAKPTAGAAASISDPAWPAASLLAGAACVFGAFALLMALGEYTWVYPSVSALPFLRAFRASTRHIVLVHLALAVLGALAFTSLSQEWGRPAERGARRPYRAMWVLVVVAWGVAELLACHFGPLWRTFSPYLASPRAWLISPALITLAAVLTMAAARGHRAALAGLVLLAAADQAVYGLHFTWSEPPQSVAEYVRQYAAPPTVSGSRVYQPLANTLGMRNIDNCGGYTGVQLCKRLTYDTRHLNALRLAGVRWATRDLPSPSRDPRWFELRRVLPRIRCVAHAVEGWALERDIEGADLTQTAYVTHPLGLSGERPGAVLRSVSQPGYYYTEVDTPGRQLVVVAESYHDGWQAIIDGKRCPIERVNGDFLGCVVEAGVHAIELRFQPESMVAGQRVTWIGLVALAGLAAAALFVARTPEARA